MSTRIRLIDIAREAGVSRVLVGKVLLDSGGDHIKVAEATAKRIRQTARRLGYQPNRSAQRLRGKTGNLIGAIINMNAPPVERDRLVAFERLAWERGYQLLISAIAAPERIEEVCRCASVLTGQGAAAVAFLTGAVVVSGNEDDAHLPSNAVYCGIKTVVGDAPGVVLDLASVYGEVVEHFVQTGRRRIGLVTVAGAMTPDLYSEDADRAVAGAVARFEGVELVARPVRVCPERRVPTVAEAARLVDVLLAEGVDAIQVSGDLIAARLIQVLKGKGVRVPEDVAVSGLGNGDIAELTSPALTTIDEMTDDVAAAMLELLIEQLDDEALPSRQRVIRPKLVVRESTRERS